MTYASRRGYFFLALALLFAGFLTMGAGCSSDPNVEGAKLDIRNKDWDRALNNLETALEANPDNVEALILKGDVLLQKAMTEQDLEAHNALIDEMIASYNRAYELSSDDEAQRLRIEQQMRQAWFQESQRGNAAFNAGSEENKEAYTQAAAYFANASAIMPDSVNSYINQAYAIYNTGDFAAAIVPLETAIEKGDMSTDTRNLLAQLYIIEGRYDEAVSFLEQAVRDFPADADLRGRLFNAYIETDQIDRGLTIAMESVEQDPSNPIYRYNYGTLLLQAERYDEAAEQLQMASENDPENFNILQNLGAAFQNQAVEVNDMIVTYDDSLRTTDTLTDAQREAIEGEIEELVERRQQLTEQSLPYLERARSLIEAQGEDPLGICSTLFRIYGQLNMIDKAEEAAECAGIDLSGEN